MAPRQWETEDPDAEYGVRAAWKVVDRVLAERKAPSAQVSAPSTAASDEETAPMEVDAGKEYLVKWRELQYDACTWEAAEDLQKWGAEAEIARFHSLEPISASAAARRVRVI